MVVFIITKMVSPYKWNTYVFWCEQIYDIYDVGRNSLFYIAIWQEIRPRACYRPIKYKQCYTAFYDQVALSTYRTTSYPIQLNLIAA